MQRPIPHPEPIPACELLGPRVAARERILTPLGTRFREERERLGLTRQKLAAHADYSLEQVRMVEGGKKQPGALLVRALGVLGGDVTYVLLGNSAGPTDRSPSLPTHECLDQLEAAIARIESQLQQLISQQTPTPDRSHTHAP